MDESCSRHAERTARGALTAVALAVAVALAAPAWGQALQAQQPPHQPQDTLPVPEPDPEALDTLDVEDLEGALASPEEGLAPAADFPADLVDRVVAVAGDSAILLSDVQEEFLRLQQQGLEPPRDPEERDALLLEILQELIDEALLLQEASQYGITARDEEVEEMVEARFRELRQSFRSEGALREAVQASGQNMFQFRQMLRAQARKQLVMNRFQQQLLTMGALPQVAVDEEEIRETFERTAGGARRPATVSFDRLVVPPRPSAAEAADARDRALEALGEIRDGTSFEVAARRYSDDPGTREAGGDLGWMRRGDLVAAFSDAAWRAPAGRAVGPVQTRFGFHLIRVNGVRGGERNLQHILIRPEIGEEDVERARELATALTDSIRGGADIGRMAQRHGYPGERVAFDDVQVNEIPDRFGSAFDRALANPAPGEVIGPFETEGVYGLPHFVIVRVTDFRGPGEYELDDVRDQIREQLVRQKQFQEYISELRERSFVQLLI